METERKRKASSPLPEIFETKKRRDEVEDDMNMLLDELEMMIDSPSNVKRVIEIRIQSLELSKEMETMVESDPETEECPPSPPPALSLPGKISVRQRKKNEQIEKRKFIQKTYIQKKRFEREESRRQLISNLITSVDKTFLAEMEKESEESITSLSEKGTNIKAPTSIVPFKTSIIRRAVEIWKTNTSIKWNPVEYHNCFTGGFVGITDPPKEDEWKCGKCGKNISIKKKSCPQCPGSTKVATIEISGCPMSEIRLRTFYLPSQKWNFHVCVEGMCNADGPMAMHFDSHSYELKNSLSLFVCEISAELHLCGDDCDTTFVNDGHEFSCLLTGRSTKQVDMKGPRWQPYGMQTFCDAWKSNPLGPRFRKRRQNDARVETLKELLDNEILYQNTSHLQTGDLPTVREMIKELAPKNDTDARKIAFSAVYLKILRVFSDDRFCNDAEQNTRKREETSTMLDKYIGRCEQHTKPANAADMYSIVNTKRLRTCYNPQVNLDVDAKNALAAYYAKKVILLWYIIITKTHNGKTNPGRFHLDDFVTTALHLFNKGFEIPQSDKGSRIELISPDPLFSVFPITSWIEEKLHPRLKDSKKRNKSITRTKKAVQIALKSALEMGISPEELKTERMSYYGMDETAFSRLRKT